MPLLLGRYALAAVALEELQDVPAKHLGLVAGGLEVVHELGHVAEAPLVVAEAAVLVVPPGFLPADAAHLAGVLGLYLLLLVHMSRV